ncbi:MAG: lysophospholipid acyltransferase family protein [Sphingomicrobium sp.]
MKSLKRFSAASPRSSVSGSSTIAWSFTASPSTAAARQPSSTWRAAIRIFALGLLLLVCIVPHLLAKLVGGRSPWPRLFLRSAARIAGARVHTVGSQPARHTLLVANHISWLDILILSGATGCAFVSKDDLGHGFVHWLADENHTIYVNRSARRESGNQVAAIQKGLRREQPLAIFPEGTVGPGDHLLPFRSTLLAAVAPAPDEVSVQPVAIDYGEAPAEISWHGEKGAANVLRILGRRGTFAVTVRLLDPLPRSSDRKQLALVARERIAAALAASSSADTRL